MRPTALVATAFAVLLATAGCTGPVKANDASSTFVLNATPKFGDSPQIVAVTNVVDGDTLDVSTGKRVRVLGIDSCEMNTTGGASAKQFAETLLSGKAVTLTREPGVDLDEHGRQLRYVTLPGGDFGEAMVFFDHTGIYAGHNDASAAYVNDLRTHESGGRNCGSEVAPVSANQSQPHTDVHAHKDDHHSRAGSKVWHKVCHHWWC